MARLPLPLPCGTEGLQQAVERAISSPETDVTLAGCTGYKVRRSGGVLTLIGPYGEKISEAPVTLVGVVGRFAYTLGSTLQQRGY